MLTGIGIRLAVCAGMLAVGASARGETVHWISIGGTYSDGANWDTGVVPGTDDRVIYDVDSSVAVNFVGSATNQRAEFRAGFVSMSAPGFVYTLTSTVFPSMRVGFLTGDVALMLLSNGRIEAEDAVFADSTGSVGNVRIGGGSSELDLGGFLIVADGGTSFLEVQAGASVSYTEFCDVGRGAGSDGVIEVTGAGSQFLGAGELTIGPLVGKGGIGEEPVGRGVEDFVQGTLRIVNGGSADVGSMTIGGRGKLEGDGTLTAAMVTNGGVVSPGVDSVATLDVVGDYVQGVGGRFEIELGGLVAGTEHDRLQVSGGIQLDGVLSVTLTGGFSPQLGHEFVVMQGMSATGGFASLETPTAPAAAMYDVRVENGDVILEVTDLEILGDLTGDMRVNSQDLGLLLGAWGTAGPEADFNNDGVVNARDLSVILGAWTDT